MIIQKAYKYQLKIAKSKQQEILQKLASFAGCRRFVWNKALDLQKSKLDKKEYFFKYTELAIQLVLWKKQEDTKFLADCHSQVLQQTLKQLDLALRNAFSKKAKQKFPQFKKKGMGDSFVYPQGFKVDVDNKRIFLPKIGYVSLRMDRPIQGTPKNVTISKSNGKWYASIQVEMTIAMPKHNATSAIGIDLGVVSTVTTSDDNLAEFKPLDLKKQEGKIKYLQRQLARRSKFNKNWQKTKQKLNKVHAKIGNKRKHHLHTISHTLSKNHAMIVVEDLKIANMVKSAKGTAEKHGKNVKQKSGLNRSILKQGWGELVRQIEYKQAWSGGITIAVNPKYTSQKCSECGHIHKDNRKSQSDFTCVACGYHENADRNAAKNILAAGHAVLACGETVRPKIDVYNNMHIFEASSLKQEPFYGIGSKPTLGNLVL
jgi:putative transposase